MPGRLTTKGRIEYQFKVCGALTVLFVEVKYKLASGTDRLNAVAQVIAEADGIYTLPPRCYPLITWGKY